jgi:hypothetical protein
MAMPPCGKLANPRPILQSVQFTAIPGRKRRLGARTPMVDPEQMIFPQSFVQIFKAGAQESSIAAQ